MSHTSRGKAQGSTGSPGRLEMKHQIFAQEFFRHYDPERAYLAAGYHGKAGHTRVSAIGRLLTHVDVQARLRAEWARLRQRVDLDQQAHAIEVCRLAYSDMRDVADWDETGVRVKPSHEISTNAARTIQKITSRTRTRVVQQDGESVPESITEVEVALHSKTQALDLLHRMYHQAQALRTVLEAKLRAVAQVAAQYVPEAEMARYLAEVRLALGDIAEEESSAEGLDKPSVAIAPLPAGMSEPAPGGPPYAPGRWW